jgi:proteasome accessory factor A
MLTTHVPPLADPDKYRRLHVTVGDSNMSELATFVKVASTLILLHMVDSGAPLPDVALEDPIGALREFSHDPDLRRTARLNDGQRLSALEIQLHYQAHAERYGDSDGLQQDLRDGFALWSRMLRQLESDPSVMHREVDWVLKRKLIEERRASANLGLGDPEISSLAADYSEVGEDGIYGQLRTNGGVDTLNADDEISRAIDQAPEGTRANLRARFIRDSRAASCNYAVDWTHLKLTDGPKRTIVCKEPALATDERVERLLARYVNASQGDR